MTQDALPADKDMIGELVKPLLASKGVGVSYARQLPAKGCDEIERSLTWYLLHKFVQQDNAVVLAFSIPP
mgnify:CR=1 FL=1